MSKDAELETAELSGYRDKVSVSRVSKKIKNETGGSRLLLSQFSLLF